MVNTLPALPEGIQAVEPVQAAPPAGDGRPLCAFTVDVEDWYQSSVDFDAPISERVLVNMDRLLAVLDDCGVKGTFFVQGMVAEAYPQLVRRIADEGHEIQSHGYSHRPLFGMDRAALRRELDYGRKTVEDAAGVRLTAFRAPDFSILRGNLWALEALVEAGFDVDSSIFAIRTRRYGIADWEVGPHYVTLAGGARILEVPVAVWTAGRVRLPVAGGGYFRLLPHPLLARALRGILNDRRPVIVYCHPYEFNPQEMAAYRGRVSTRFYLSQSMGRGTFARKVRYLLGHLPFGRFDAVMAAWGLSANGHAAPG